jgi:hypothetical protein
LDSQPIVPHFDARLSNARATTGRSGQHALRTGRSDGRRRSRAIASATCEPRVRVPGLAASRHDQRVWCTNREAGLDRRVRNSRTALTRRARRPARRARG